MSYQYVKQIPNFINQSYTMPQGMGFSTQATFAPYQPYTANMYSAGGVFYPFNNPLYSPKIPQNYTKLGEVTSSTGEVAHMYRLSNGHRVAIVPRKNEATIVKTFINAGSINEFDPKRGEAHMEEHMHFQGSANLKSGDVFRLTSSMGASTNASTDYAKVDYYILAPYMDEENLKKTIEIQGDMLSKPLFGEKELESEKGPVCSEISMMNDDPMTVGFDRVVRNLFQFTSKSQNMVAGSIDTVQSITPEDLHKFHQTYYTPKNLVTVVVGEVEPENVIDLISKNFTLKPTTNEVHQEVLTPLKTPQREDLKSSKTSSTSVFLGFAGPLASDARDMIAYQMLGYYISQCSSSDFKYELDKLNGSFDMSLQKVGLREKDPYAIVNLMSLNPGDEQKGLDIFYDAIQKLQTKPLSDDDMKMIKTNLKKSLILGMSDSEDICDILGVSMLDNSIEKFSSYDKILESITKEELMAAARKYFDLNKVSIVVVHPSSVKDDDIKRNYLNSKYSMQNVSNAQNGKNISFKGAKRISTEGIQEYKLDNNTHLAVNDTNSDICVFSWSVNTPPIKPKNPNIPVVLKYIFEKGTDFKTQNELERYKELRGISSAIYVNGKTIEIAADCMSESAKDTLELMNELMYHPNFSERDFENAKAFARDMLKASQKDAGSNLLDRLYPGYFPTENAMLKQLEELTLDDIVEFYNDLLKNASSAFVATVPKKKYAELTNTTIKTLNNSNTVFQEFSPKLYPMFEAVETPTVIYDTDDLNQAQIYKSYKFPLSGNIEDEIKFELLNTILGGTPNSRLFKDLRENENLAYSVSSSVQSFENTGIMTLKIQTTTDNPDIEEKSYNNVQRSLDGFKKHTDMLSSELVSDEELAAAKMRLKQNIIGQCQNPISETDLIKLNILEPYGVQRIDEYFKAIDKMTKEDILKTAKFVFSYNPTISVLASDDTIKDQMSYLKTQGTTFKAA